MVKTIDFGQEMLWLQPQPDFPTRDLTDANAALLGGFVLPQAGSVEAHAKLLEEDQQGIFPLAWRAMQLDSEADELSLADYRAFCRGFAAFEFVSLAVRPRLYDGTTAVRQTHRLYMVPDVFADYELGKRHAKLVERRPNTFGAIAEAGHRRYETKHELKARALGAQIACELQLPSAA